MVDAFDRGTIRFERRRLRDAEPALLPLFQTRCGRPGKAGLPPKDLELPAREVTDSLQQPERDRLVLTAISLLDPPGSSWARIRDEIFRQFEFEDLPVLYDKIPARWYDVERCHDTDVLCRWSAGLHEVTARAKVDLPFGVPPNVETVPVGDVVASFLVVVPEGYEFVRQWGSNPRCCPLALEPASAPKSGTQDTEFPEDWALPPTSTPPVVLPAPGLAPPTSFVRGFVRFESRSLDRRVGRPHAWWAYDCWPVPVGMVFVFAPPWEVQGGLVTGTLQPAEKKRMVGAAGMQLLPAIAPPITWEALLVEILRTLRGRVGRIDRGRIPPEWYRYDRCHRRTIAYVVSEEVFEITARAEEEITLDGVRYQEGDALAVFQVTVPRSYHWLLSREFKPTCCPGEVEDDGLPVEEAEEILFGVVVPEGLPAPDEGWHLPPFSPELPVEPPPGGTGGG